MKLKRFFIIAVVVFTIIGTLSAGDKSSGDGLQKGQKMAEFGMRSLDMKSGKLKKMIWTSDFVGKDPATPKKALVLNFYANWCKPCIKEMPFLQKMWDKYQKKGLQVLSVNFRSEGEKFGDTLKKSIEILKKEKVTYPVLFDRFTNRNQLIYMGSRAKLPCLVIIDRKGNIVEKIAGEESKSFDDIEKEIKKLLEG